jgi:predicted anti-sigma-YlaC factor YlaD
VNCTEVQDHLSPHLEDRLGPKERAEVSEHLLGCLPCRALRDEMRELLSDLHALSKAQQLPEGLDDRILARVPAARRKRSRRSAQSVTWQRAAVWAFVFFGAWWQLVGTQLGSLAADEVAPAAAELVAEAKEATLRRQAELMPSGDLDFSLSGPVDRAGDSLASFSRALHRALFVPESQQTPEPQTRPAGSPQGDLQP